MSLGMLRLMVLRYVGTLLGLSPTVIETLLAIAEKGLNRVSTLRHVSHHLLTACKHTFLGRTPSSHVYVMSAPPRSRAPCKQK